MCVCVCDELYDVDLYDVQFRFDDKSSKLFSFCLLVI